METNNTLDIYKYILEIRKIKESLCQSKTKIEECCNTNSSEESDTEDSE